MARLRREQLRAIFAKIRGNRAVKLGATVGVTYGVFRGAEKLNQFRKKRKAKNLKKLEQELDSEYIKRAKASLHASLSELSSPEYKLSRKKREKIYSKVLFEKTREKIAKETAEHLKKYRAEHGIEEPSMEFLIRKQAEGYLGRDDVEREFDSRVAKIRRRRKEQTMAVDDFHRRLKRRYGRR